MLKYLRYPFYLLAFFVFLYGCGRPAHVTKVETSQFVFDTINTKKEDTSALLLIKPFKHKMDSLTKEVLGYTEKALIKGMPEGLLNNFVADLILKKAQDYYKPGDSHTVDFCLLNNGGLRTALPRGAIKLGRIYELMPFENNLVVITLTGEKTKQMCDYIAKQGGMPISGFTMGIKDTAASVITSGGKAVDFSKNYKIVTSDYLAAGGDKMTFFKDPVKWEDLGIKVRDAIIAYIKEENQKGNKLTSKLDNRIYYEK